MPRRSGGLGGSGPHLHDGVMTDVRAQRWAEVLAHLVDALPGGSPGVVVDGPDAQTAEFADRFAAAVRASGRRCVRLEDPQPGGAETVALAQGGRWRANPPGDRWDVVIWLRTAAPPGDPGDGADVVVDLRDPGWPVIRHVDPRLTARGRWYVSESRAFFGPRAATWDTTFGDDVPAYAAAVAEAALPAGGVVADVGCGTGRALPVLRSAVGERGFVVGIDFTPQMLGVARERGRADDARLVLADARRLPFGTAALDAAFAAGLLMHLPDPGAGLRELARVTRPGGRLVLFHPSGRAALAARHGRTVRPDEALSEGPLRALTARTGWQVDAYDDAPHRFLAVATRA
jgi:SAM-dependent methyltransferase